MKIIDDKIKMNKQNNDSIKTINNKWNFSLYIAGHSTKSVVALKNLKLICEEQFKGDYNLEIIDLIKTPQHASEAQILAIPTLVCKTPLPVKRIIGDLSDTHRVLAGLGVLE